MPPSPCTHVRKRDGRLVPFEPAKLRASIQAAARACGCDNGFFTHELADAVSLHLAHLAADAPPDTAAVAAAVEKVLDDLRYHAVAQAYRDYRHQRDAHRARCTVIKPTQPSLFASDVAPQVTVIHGGHTRPWERARIVHALEREARLGRAVAEDIARRVEEKLLASDLRRVTTTLIRALTDNELLARGYTSALHQRSSVTVPFHDIDHVLATSPESLAEQLGREVVRLYVLSRLYSDDVADAHRRGMLDIGGLDHPLAQHRAVTTLPPLVDTAAIVEHVQTWTHRMANACVAHVAVVIPDQMSSACAALAAQAWSAAARGLDEGHRVVLVLSRAQLTACLEPLSDIPPAPACELWCVGETADAHALAESLYALHMRGWGVAWHPYARPMPAAQLITLNMPQAVYRARQHDLDSVIEEVYRSVDVAAHAHRQFRQFQRAHGRADAAQAGVVTCIGLDEAVAVLTGSGMFDNADAAKCVRVVLGVVHDALRSAASALEIPLHVRLDEPTTSGRRLAGIDQALFPELFGFLPLQPDALAHVIPPYRPVQLLLNRQPVQTLMAACQNLSRYAGDSVIRLDATGLGAPGVQPYVHAVLSAQCGFALAGAHA